MGRVEFLVREENMSTLMHSLLCLPIHRKTREKYDSDYKTFVESKKKDVENFLGRPFDELDYATRISYEELWLGPYWKFNDIVGFVDIGMDGENCMTADIFLKRKKQRYLVFIFYYLLFST